MLTVFYSILVEILCGNLYQSELLNQNIYMHKYFKKKKKQPERYEMGKL